MTHFTYSLAISQVHCIIVSSYSYEYRGVDSEKATFIGIYFSDMRSQSWFFIRESAKVITIIVTVDEPTVYSLSKKKKMKNEIIFAAQILYNTFNL